MTPTRVEFQPNEEETEISKKRYLVPHTLSYCNITTSAIWNVLVKAKSMDVNAKCKPNYSLLSILTTLPEILESPRTTFTFHEVLIFIF